MKKTTISESMIHEIFDEVTVSRGRQTYNKSFVCALNEEDGLLCADVGDDNKETYSTMVRWKNGKPVGNCSCPAGFNCKHVVAVLFAKLHQQRQPALALFSQEEKEEANTQQEKPSPFSMWLGRLDKSPNQLAMQHARKGQCIVYMLQQHQRHGMILTFHVARMIKSGGYGRITAYQPANAIKQNCPAYVQMLDRRILRMAAENHEASLRRFYVLRGEDDVTMLKQAITTGRCHWNNTDSRALRLGEKLSGHWIWKTNKVGQQQLTLSVNSADMVIIPLSPPWYLDQDQGVCGRISAEESDELTDILLHLPLIEPNCSEEDLRMVREQLPDNIPAPTCLPYQKHQQQSRPVLHLRSFPTAGIYAGTLPDYIHVAEFLLDYDDHCQRPYQPSTDDFVRLVNEDGITDFQRDRDMEQRTLDILEKYQLQTSVPWLHKTPLQPHQFTLFDPQQWPQWLVEQVPVLEAAGIEVHTHPSFRHQLTEVDHWVLETGGEGWFGQASMKVQLHDGEQLELHDAIASWLEENPDRLHRQAMEELQQTESIALSLPQGRVISIPGSMLANLLHYMIDAFTASGEENSGLSAPQLIELRSSLEAEEKHVEIGPDPWLEKVHTLLHPDSWPDLPVPDGLNAELRDYQHEGLQWLQMLRKLGMHGILADDMGLGKTIQGLAHILVEKEADRLNHPALVICPTSLVHNWQREAAKFTPDLSVLVLHGSNRSRDFARIFKHDLVITTYPLLIRDIETLQEQPWSTLILDEAQYIKNPDARCAQLVRQLNSASRLCMTGTPMENHLGELWSLFDFLMPGYLFSRKKFRRLFRLPIENDGDSERQAMLNVRIRPFVMRRRKEDVAKELPPKTEIIRTMAMDAGQQEVYEGVRLAMQKRVRDALALSGVNKNHIVLLDALLKMRQVCCDPRLVKHMKFGDVIPSSAKMNLLRDMLPELIEEGRRILLFSQFTSMLSLIEDMVQELSIPYLKLTGATRNRQDMVDEFQQGNTPLFMISLKAGGTGLNLTAADTVIHYDPWWNPAAEHQASDRAHRIGQEKPVFVYKLITEGTVEEKILDLQRRKQALADNIYAAGEAGVSNLTQAEINTLFEPIED